MIHDLINELVSYRQLLDDIDGIEGKVMMTYGDKSFAILGPLTVTNLRMALRHFKND